VPLAALAGGLCAVFGAVRATKADRTAPSPETAAPAERPAAPQTTPPDRAQAGIEQIERWVADKKLPPRGADAFRTQMALRLAASGADRKTVETWLGRAAPAPGAPPSSVAAAASAAAGPEAAAPDYSALTPEEREVIGMNANFIRAARLSNPR
jgi:hypothetical protein